MAKVTGPLLSLTARGSVGKTMTFSVWKGIAYVRQLVTPTYSNTFKQQAVRDLMTQATQAWKTNATITPTTINSTYKNAFDAAAAGSAYSGFNLFISACMSKNYDATTSPYFDGNLVLPTDPTDILP